MRFLCSPVARSRLTSRRLRDRVAAKKEGKKFLNPPQHDSRGLKLLDPESERKLLFSVMVVAMAVAGPAWAQNATQAPQADKWSGTDKQLHFSASATLGFSARRVFQQEPWKAVGVSIMPGVLKELTDRQFSRKDLTADFAGALFGVYVGGCYAQYNAIVCGFNF